MSVNLERGWHAGETLPRRYQLWENVATRTPLNLHQKTVELSAATLDGDAVTLAGVVTVVDPDNGIVEVQPDDADFTDTQRELKVQFKVTDNSAKVGYVPSEPMRWPIWP